MQVTRNLEVFDASGFSFCTRKGKRQANGLGLWKCVERRAQGARQDDITVRGQGKSNTRHGVTKHESDEAQQGNKGQMAVTKSLGAQTHRILHMEAPRPTRNRTLHMPLTESSMVPFHLEHADAS